MRAPRTVTIPCPFSVGDDDCPHTLTATMYTGRPATQDDPAEPVTVEDIRGCPLHVDDQYVPDDAVVELEELFMDQADQDEQDAKERHENWKIDERLGK